MGWSDRSYQELAARIADISDRLLEQNRMLLEQQKALLDELASLKRVGFVPHVPEPMTVPAEPDPVPASVISALRQRVREGSELWYTELEHAKRKLREGTESDKVAESILEGGKFNPW